MQTRAVIFEEPHKLILEDTRLITKGEDLVFVDTLWSGISTGTERLLWEGTMPHFPGMAYPLVPGYETVGTIVDAPNHLKHRIGERVFIPGCSSYEEVRGLFGGAASLLAVDSDKAIKVPENSNEEAILLALAATAYHALTKKGSKYPDLIIGNGILGRLAARLCTALGVAEPTIWEKEPARRADDSNYKVVAPEEDEGNQYDCIMDLSGDASILDTLVRSLNSQGEIILAGFYSKDIQFAFPPAFMKEAKFIVSAEWQPEDLKIVRDLIDQERLSLSGLITHHKPTEFAAEAYHTAFNDPHCLKMVLDWKNVS
ncbi:MAG: chlorophyll synthesis pathway protein BchC [Pseudomonadota bacterium]